jgi:hypothetical protein
VAITPLDKKISQMADVAPSLGMYIPLVDLTQPVASQNVRSSLSAIQTLISSGSVSSFSAGNLSPLFTTSVATATTTPELTFSLSGQSSNRVFAGPSAGAAAAPTFRALVAADIPNLSSVYQAANANLAAISLLTTTSYGLGILESADAAAARTYLGVGSGTGTVTSVNLTAPAAGITVAGGPITTSGSITLALADDLAALEALSGTNTIYYRSGTSTWSAVTIGTNLTFSAGTLSASGGSGTIGGSSGSTDNALIRADGTGGSTIQSSNVTLADSGTALVFSGAAGLTATGTNVDVSLTPGSTGKNLLTRALWVNGALIADVLYFKGGPGGAGSTASIAFDSTDTTFGTNVSSRISFVDDGAYGAHMTFCTRSSGGAGTTTTEWMRLTSGSSGGGNLLIGTTSTTGLTGTGGLKINSSTASSSTTTGALIVAGGVGVGGALSLGTALTVANGGTGRATSTTAYGLLAAGTTATGAHQTLAAGATTEILVGGGASALPIWTTATGSGAPVRGTGPTLSQVGIGGAPVSTHAIAVHSSTADVVMGNNGVQAFFPALAGRGLFIQRDGIAGAHLFSAAQSSTFIGLQTDGTLASPTATTTGRSFAVSSSAFDGTNYYVHSRIRQEATQDQTASLRGAMMAFDTILTGATSLAERARISGAGNLLVGTTSDVTGPGKIKALGIEDTPIGATTPSTGAFTSIINGSTTLLQTSVSLTDGAGAQVGTLTNAPLAGNPTKWLAINDNGTTRYVPSW